MGKSERRHNRLLDDDEDCQIGRPHALVWPGRLAAERRDVGAAMVFRRRRLRPDRRNPA